MPEQFTVEGGVLRECGAYQSANVMGTTLLVLTCVGITVCDADPSVVPISRASDPAKPLQPLLKVVTSFATADRNIKGRLGLLAGGHFSRSRRPFVSTSSTSGATRETGPVSYPP